MSDSREKPTVASSKGYHTICSYVYIHIYTYIYVCICLCMYMYAYVVSPQDAHSMPLVTSPKTCRPFPANKGNLWIEKLIPNIKKMIPYPSTGMRTFWLLMAPVFSLDIALACDPLRSPGAETTTTQCHSVRVQVPGSLRSKSCLLRFEI